MSFIKVSRVLWSHHRPTLTDCYATLVVAGYIFKTDLENSHSFKEKEEPDSRSDKYDNVKRSTAAVLNLQGIFQVTAFLCSSTVNEA